MSDTIQSLANLATAMSCCFSAIQTLVVLATLIYIAKEVRETATATKASTYQSLIGAFAEIEARISQDENLAKIYTKGIQQYSSLESVDDRRRFNELMSSYFNLYEAMFYQHKLKLFERSLWTGWCQNMREELANPGIAEWWQRRTHLYSEKFRNFIDQGKCPEA